jgi:hypothetical protein
MALLPGMYFTWMGPWGHLNWVSTLCMLSPGRAAWSLAAAAATTADGIVEGQCARHWDVGGWHTDLASGVLTHAPKQKGIDVYMSHDACSTVP